MDFRTDDRDQVSRATVIGKAWALMPILIAVGAAAEVGRLSE